MARAPKPTRTYNPLHFEDLEPHRFEDLVRQLAYGFRDWIDIEAVGRTGTDDGSDTRAFESIPAVPSEIHDDEDENSSLPLGKRLWVIQCKRQASFGPADAKKVVEGVKFGTDEGPYGLIVAAAANISLATRRALVETARDRGFQEIYLWGKAELEDQLYQPKNDNLLFGYFGVSVQVRRRSIRTEERALVTLKKQLARVLGGVDKEHYQEVLLRSPDDRQYPFLGDRKRFAKDRLWWYYRFVEHWPPNKLIFEMMRCPAFVNVETGEWDAIFDHDVLEEQQRHKLWGLEPDREGKEWQREWRANTLERERYMRFFEDLPEDQRGYLSVYGVVPFDRILALDELGDRVNPGPHLLVARDSEGRFFDEHFFIPKIKRLGNSFERVVFAREESRIARFPELFPRITQSEYDAIQKGRGTESEIDIGAS